MVQIIGLIIYIAVIICFRVVIHKQIKKARKSAVEAKLMTRGLKKCMLIYCDKIDDLIKVYNDESYRNIISQNNYLNEYYSEYGDQEEVEG